VDFAGLAGRLSLSAVLPRRSFISACSFSEKVLGAETGFKGLGCAEGCPAGVWAGGVLRAVSGIGWACFVLHEGRRFRGAPGRGRSRRS
jgi:hypothetical protein